MAIPKVFVSSTCYDLQEERAQLERFISGYGFHPVLSEYSGVFYNPDIHTHDACIKEIEHCDIFVLLIAGRFGGKVKDGEGESITQAEHNRARELGLPIFSFVKANINEAQHCYKKNLLENGVEFANKITYPAIPKPSDAIPIFKFMDSVHLSDKNNGIETYHSFNDIEKHLKKQLAGMFFSFLQKRKEEDKVEKMTSILGKLAGSSSKLEALVSSLHDKEVGEDNTKKLIHDTETRRATFNFFRIVFKIAGSYITTIEDPQDEWDSISALSEPLQLTMRDIEEIASTPIPPDKGWIEYVTNIPFFSLETDPMHSHQLSLGYASSETDSFVSANEALMAGVEYDQGVVNSTKKMRIDALLEICREFLIFKNE